MDTSFELIDNIYQILANDATLLGYLGNPNTDKLKNQKIRRQMPLFETISPDDLNFISFYVANAAATGNFMANKAILRIDYYTSLRYDAKNIATRVKDLLQLHYAEDFDLKAEGERNSGIVGVYMYRQQYAPLIGS